MNRTIAAVPTLLRVAFSEIVAYRAEMVIWVLSATLPLVMLGLWNAAAADGPLAGYGQAEFARYFTVTLLVRHLTSVWLAWELNMMIRQGSLSPWLLRPVSYLWWNLAEALAAWPMRILVLIPMLGILAFWRPEVLFCPDLLHLLLGSFSILLGLLVQYCIHCVFGMLAFWFDQSLGLLQGWFAVWSILSGYLVPMALLPPAVQTAAHYLPFRATLGVPVEILLGAPDPGWEVLYQLIWLTILAGMARGMWAAGLRRYGAFGA
jgi:ABC-2 type transport system permease protein